MTQSRHIAVAGLLALFAAVACSALPAVRGAEDEETSTPAAAETAPDEAVERDAPAAGGAAPQDEEPPLEFELEVGGEAVNVQLDRPATVDIGGRKVEVRLTAKPDRLFRGGGVSFRYPRDHGFEVERDGDETTWTFDGGGNITVLLQSPDGSDPDELARSAVEAIVAQHGKDNCRTRATSIALGTDTVEGTRIDVVLDDDDILVQEFFAWQPREGGPTYSMIVQDTPPGPGATSDATKQVRELLAKTFKHDKPAPKE